MELHEIFAHYVRGSQGFCIAVDTHGGFEISRDEIERIAERAENAEQFIEIWEHENWWTDAQQ
ncbi:hypothetical protein [Halodurantibacterium flavum]|uniref:Uncharacterized protein n=1 Tax=Halodurantibacterium flavum TaxID=1382802 RepID=A0ABW4S867_9RHOB